MRLAALAVVLAVIGCVRSSSVQCSDGTVCPSQHVCAVVEDVTVCVTQEQLDACATAEDLTMCTDGGTCHDHVCLPTECGNTRTDLGEHCDDGNLVDGDGCSARCDSDESCGNAVVDTITGEHCDDGSNVDHDGCSSACTPETLDWHLAVEPGPRMWGRAAYDAARGKVVVFHGPTAQVFEWDAIWRPITGIATPPTRTEFALAYDHARQRVVLFGGRPGAGGNALGDTWSWDGVRWTPEAAGPALANAAMAYDARRKVLVVFGGSDSEARAGTWEYDGTAWSDVTPSGTSPSARAGAGMAYDPARGVIVLYGGSGSYETWEYDGTSWTQKSPTTMPQNNAPALAFEPTLGRVVMFGGYDNQQALVTTRTWLWDGTNWSLAPGTFPSALARQNHAFAEDGRGRLLAYGGQNGGLLDDTWLFDGTSWARADRPPAAAAAAVVDAREHGRLVRFGGGAGSPLTPGPADTWELTRRGWQRFPDGPGANDSPPGLLFSRMVFDAARDQIVLFGGTTSLSASTFDDRTWLRTGATWAPVRPTPSPSGRILHSFTYDAARGNAVLFGGYSSTGSVLGDTWLWNGTTWMQVTTPGPPARAGAAMAYDPIARVVVLFGGRDAFGDLLDDVWIWDGGTWAQVTQAAGTQPPPQDGASLTWDPAGRHLLLAGSVSDESMDVWQWRGDAQQRAWTFLPVVTVPKGRLFEATVTSFDGSGITVFGGAVADAVAGTAADEWWELRFDGARGSDACALPFDADGDGLTVCDDPDCWRVCAPNCPPGTSCAVTEPQCGDGTCSALESCHTCPQDCPTCAEPRCGDFVCETGETCPGDCP